MALTQPSSGALIARALRLDCPRCGKAKMYLGWFRMHERCPACELKFEREPGYFLGSIYLNYGLTALLTTIGYISLRFGMQIESRWLLVGFAVFCVAFPMFYFRYARALWLAMDCRFDKSLFADANAASSGASHERN